MRRAAFGLVQASEAVHAARRFGVAEPLGGPPLSWPVPRRALKPSFCSALQAIFPSGGCDFSQPGIEQQGTVAWQTYQDDAAGGAVVYGGRPLGEPPVSR